jgi:hypothetical protein
MCAQAGRASLATDVNTATCLRFEERPPTPERDRKWRTVQDAGARIRHPGLVRAAALWPRLTMIRLLRIC